MCRLTSVTSNQPEEYATFGEECDNPYLTSYQPRLFYVAVNAHKGMRDEQYLLSRVTEALNVGYKEKCSMLPCPSTIRRWDSTHY
jgi:hypothetical protein